MEKQKLNQSIILLNLLKSKFVGKMLRAINETPGISQTQLFIKLRCKDNQVSQYADKLAKYNLISKARSGKNVYYYLNFDIIEEKINAIKRFVHN